LEPWSRELAGRLEEHELESAALRGNPLGDPHLRPLWVYAPPAYAAEPDRRFPAIYLIQGHTGQLDMWRNRSAFRPTVPELVDRLFAEENCPPALVVFVDAWTSYGGSQFLDSPGVGNYHTYLCDEIVPFVDARYRTLAAAAHRGITGKSSGGYGAMVTPMLRPDLFGGLATHAGDALFELCYLPSFGDAARALRDGYDGSFDAFWADFRSGRPAWNDEDDPILVDTYAMAAAYSANSAATAAYEAATRIPVKMEGSAQGSSTRRKMANRLARSVRITRTWSGSTDRNPSRAETVMGKKQTSATITSFGARPKPR